MGMFDEVKYEYILPLEVKEEVKALGIVPEDLLFQTKDLDSTLSLYTINRDGRLIFKNVKYKWVDDDNAFLKGYMEEESHTLDDMNYHGDLKFYAYENVKKDGNHFAVILDYRARFTNGKLEEVKLENCEVNDDNDRQEDLNRMYREMEREKNLWYNKYLRYTKFYKNYIRKPIFSIVKFLHKLTSDLNTFILRYL